MINNLTDLNPIIQKVMQKKDLTFEEAKKAFLTIFIEDKEGYFFLAFMTALSTKGETVDELYGLYKANEELCPKISVGVSSDKITDLSGSGGAKLKTINVSTAASFVVAGADFYVEKQSQFGITSPTGSADIFKAFGIDISKIGVEEIKNGLHKVGIIPFHYQFTTKDLENRSILARKVLMEKGVSIRTPFHVASFVFTPIIEVKRRIYGIFDEKFLPILAQLFQKIGYEKGMVFSGLDGICEISNIGPTRIIEFDKEKLKDYVIEPSDLGLKKARYEDIKAVSKEQNIIDFLRVLYNKDKGPKRDIVLANAAAAFYVLDRVKTLRDGVELAKKILEEGKASQKLEELVRSIGDVDKLNSWKDEANL